jgi:hypothetical protein
MWRFVTLPCTAAPYPLEERIANRSSDLAESNLEKSRMTRDGRRLSPREYSHASGLAAFIALMAR